MKSENEKTSSRWYAQKWVFDNTVALLGPESIASGALNRSYEAIGSDAAQEAQMLRSRVKRFADIGREVKRLAVRRERLARDAENAKRYVTARDNYFAASIYYGAAKWPIMEDNNKRLIDLDAKMIECYQKYIQYADHYIERVKIHFDGSEIFGYFHRPKGELTEYPTILALGGMDSFKEQFTRLYGDRFLERGFAVFSLDGPGQGEALTRGFKVKPDSYDRIGKAIVDYLYSRRDVDKKKIALWGVSFGTYWGPRLIANEARLRAAAFQSVCHEPEGKSIFNSAHPAFKLRHMWMAGYTSEEEFERSYCSKLTLEGIGERISQPLLIAAGDADPLSPIEFTYDFFKALAGKKRLLIYEGEAHGIADPQLLSTIADFISDVFSGMDVENEIVVIEPGGANRSVVKEYIAP